jgi:hypothetical protein
MSNSIYSARISRLEHARLVVCEAAKRARKSCIEYQKVLEKGFVVGSFEEKEKLDGDEKSALNNYEEDLKVLEEATDNLIKAEEGV